MNASLQSDTQQTLSDDQREAYASRGYLHLKGVFRPEEVAAWEAESDRLLALSEVIHEENWRTPFQRFNDGSWKLLKFDPVIDLSAVFRSVSEDPRLTGAVRDCLQDEASLTKDKLIFKSPGQQGFRAHQDWAWWQPFPQNMLSAMVAIDGAAADNGALEVYPGKHHDYIPEPGAMRSLTDAEIAELDEARWEMIETEPGDVILFHALTPHRSGTNHSARSRRQLYFSYNGARDGDFYEAHYKHYCQYVQRNLSDFFKARRFFR